jgi:hypothetical protein
MMIANRTNDAAVAEVAAQQIEAAYEATRSGRQAVWAAFFQEQLAKARTIRDRLKMQSGECNMTNCGTPAVGEAKKP